MSRMHGSRRTASEEAAYVKDLRHTGETALGCREALCVHYGVCGGTQAANQFNCFACEGPACATCDLTCPYAKAFTERMLDVGGLDCNALPKDLRQPPITLPEYVPVVLHASSRTGLLQTSFAALPLYRLFRMAGGEYRSIAADAKELRQRFLLSPATKIILRGVDQDKYLETYWKHRRKDRAAEQLARLGIFAIIAPNFSHFLDAPRTHSLYNRKRQLICLAELANAGLTVIPHLNAAHPGDWQFWLDWLRANPQIAVVAIEFQTGRRTPTRGRAAIEQIRRIRDQLGRQLQLILVGGSRFAAAAAPWFRNLSVMDVRPFWNAMHRRLFEPRRGKWLLSPTMPWAMLDDQLDRNIRTYRFWIERRIQNARFVAGNRVA